MKQIEKEFVEKSIIWSGSVGGMMERTRHKPFFRLVSEDKVSVEEFKNLKSDDLQSPPTYFMMADRNAIQEFMWGGLTVHKMK